MEKRSGPASVAAGQTQTADPDVILNRVTCAIDALVRAPRVRYRPTTRLGRMRSLLVLSDGPEA